MAANNRYGTKGAVQRPPQELNNGSSKHAPLYPSVAPPQARGAKDASRQMQNVIEAGSHVNRLHNGGYAAGFNRTRDPSQESNGSRERVENDKLYSSVNFPDIVIS